MQQGETGRLDRNRAKRNLEVSTAPERIVKAARIIERYAVSGEALADTDTLYALRDRLEQMASHLRNDLEQIEQVRASKST